jgi:hypothetical protein
VKVYGAAHSRDKENFYWIVTYLGGKR